MPWPVSELKEGGVHRGEAHRVPVWIRLSVLATVISHTTFVGYSELGWMTSAMSLHTRSWVQLGSELLHCCMITLSPPTHPEIQPPSPLP